MAQFYQVAAHAYSGPASHLRYDFSHGYVSLAAPGTPAAVAALPAATPAAVYDEDFFLWTQRQAALIRTGQLESMDLEHVAEEIESLGISDRRQRRDRLEVLMVHLLRWQSQPMHRSGSRQRTIHFQRAHIEELLEESPSLRRELAELSREAYAVARDGASAETGFAVGTFPSSLPYTPEQILDDDFYPGPIDER